MGIHYLVFPLDRRLVDQLRADGVSIPGAEHGTSALGAQINGKITLGHKQ